MQIFRLVFLVVLAAATLASCSSSRRSSGQAGQVIVIKDSKAARTPGYKKGWTKNPNNPHHPRTTNPGHTKHKSGHGGNTVIIVNNAAPAKGNHPKGKPGKGGQDKGHPGKGGKGNGKKK